LARPGRPQERVPATRLATASAPFRAQPTFFALRHPLLLSEESTIVVAGYMVLAGAVAFLAPIAWAATRPGTSRVTGILFTAGLWGLCGAATLDILLLFTVADYPSLWLIPLAFLAIAATPPFG
jgi:hypothetical protein